MHHWSGGETPEIGPPKTVSNSFNSLVVWPFTGQVRGWGSSAANATRTRGCVFVRSSDGIARLRVKLELGFLRQVFADWALVSGERRCRRSHTVDVGVGKEFWILGWGETNEWPVYWRLLTSEFSRKSQYQHDGVKLVLEHRESEPSTGRVKRFDTSVASRAETCIVVCDYRLVV